MPILSLPDYFTWATDANRTVTPASVATLDADEGWDYNDRPPPKVMNYIHNLQEQWSQRTVGNAIGTWTGNHDTLGGGSTDIALVIRDLASGKWMALEVGAATGGWESYDGLSWVSTAAFPTGTIKENARLYSTVDQIVVGTTNGVSQTADVGATWSNTAVTHATVDMANKGLATMFITVHLAGRIRRWLTGYSGGQTTPAFYPWGTTDLASVTGLSGTDWMVIDAATPQLAYTSTDDGDNWAQIAGKPSDAVANFAANRIRYDDGTVIAVGDDTSVGCAAYSTDDGATWTASTFNTYDPPDTLNSIEPCGNKCWVAIGTVNTTPAPHAGHMVDLWYSFDDGINFHPAIVNIDNSLPTNNVVLNDIWCDGQSLMIVGTEDIVLRSQAIGAL